jgi:hypothetical protein
MGGFMAGLLTREQILKTKDRTHKDVKCPEWGGTVRVQSLTGSERDAFEESILGQRNKDGTREVVAMNLRAKLVALSVVDKDGNQLFSKDDVLALGEKNAKPLDRLFSEAQKLSGITKDDVEEMVKNSGTGQGAGLLSDLPNTSEE